MISRLLMPISLLLSLLIVGCTSPDPTLVQRQASELAAKGDQGSLTQAAALLSDLDMENTPVEVYALHVLCLMRSGQMEDALVVAGDGLQTYPEDFHLNYVAGKIYHDSGRYKDALPFLERACEVRQNDPNVALLRFRSACKSDVADIDFYQRHVTDMDEFKNDSLVYNELALFYLRKGDPYKAMQAIGPALQMDNAHPVVYRNAGVINDGSLNLSKVAMRYYRKYLLLLGEEQHERGADIRRRLKQLAGV